jgi:hypothetical protein
VDSAFAIKAWWINNRRWCQLPSIHVCYRLRSRREGLARYSSSPFFICDIPSTHLQSKVDGTRTQTFDQGQSGLHRRDTRQQHYDDSASKIWGPYLSRERALLRCAPKFWLEAQMVFITSYCKFCHEIVPCSPRGAVQRVFSP